MSERETNWCHARGRRGTHTEEERTILGDTQVWKRQRAMMVTGNVFGFVLLTLAYFRLEGKREVSQIEKSSRHDLEWLQLASSDSRVIVSRELFWNLCVLVIFCTLETALQILDFNFWMGIIFIYFYFLLFELCKNCYFNICELFKMLIFDFDFFLSCQWWINLE